MERLFSTKGSFLRRLLILSILLILPCSEGRPSWDSDSESRDEWREGELSEVRVAILNELGLHLSPYEAEHTETLPKSNISASEYKRAYAEYIQRIRMRNTEEKGLLDYRQRNRIRLFHIYKPGSIEMYDERETRLDFNLHLEGSSDLRIVRGLLDLPDGCQYFDLNTNETVEGGELDVTHFLTSWLSRQRRDPVKSPFRISLFCPPEPGKRDEPFPSRKDLLLTSLKVVSSRGSGRRKRSSYSLRNYESHPIIPSRDCAKTRHGKTCCRRSMKINFAELKIRDLILEPKEFDAHMCSGRCNGRRLPFASTHAMLQQTLHQARGGNKEIPRPCCAPRKLRHLDVLHTVPGTDTLKITILANAIVEECSCS